MCHSKESDNVRFPLSAVFSHEESCCEELFRRDAWDIPIRPSIHFGATSDPFKECKNPILNFQNRVLEFFGSLFFEWMHRIAFWVSRSDAERGRE